MAVDKNNQPEEEVFALEEELEHMEKERKASMKRGLITVILLIVVLALAYFLFNYMEKKKQVVQKPIVVYEKIPVGNFFKVEGIYAGFSSLGDLKLVKCRTTEQANKLNNSLAFVTRKEELGFNNFIVDKMEGNKVYLRKTQPFKIENEEKYKSLSLAELDFRHFGRNDKKDFKPLVKSGQKIVITGKIVKKQDEFFVERSGKKARISNFADFAPQYRLMIEFAYKTKSPVKMFGNIIKAAKRSEMRRGLLFDFEVDSVKIGL